MRRARLAGGAARRDPPLKRPPIHGFAARVERNGSRAVSAHGEGEPNHMDAGPDIEARHHHHTGRQWVDVVLGVSAVLISLISLLLAIENGNAMKRLVQANSWPFVNIGVSDTDENGNRLLILAAQNKGIGPAKIQTLEVFYNHKPVSDATALIHAMLGPAAADAHVPFVGSSLVGNVLSSKESISFLVIQDKSISPEIMNTISVESKNLGFRMCYCSVFDECWTHDRMGGRTPPQPVKACPTPETPFQN